MATTITFGGLSISVGLGEVAADAARRAAPWRRRLGSWLRHRRALRDLRAADPRILRDVGLTPPAPDPRRALFVADPAPLWGIGEAPRPRLGRDAGT